MNETPVAIESNTFSNRTNATLYVPCGSKAAYHEAAFWKEFKEIVEIGDVNNDDYVNVTDIMAIANYILKIPMNAFNERAADVNGDNRINVTDIMGIANIILKVPNTSRAGNVEGLEPQ